MLSKISISFYIPTSKCRSVQNFPCYSTHLLLSIIVAMLVDVMGYLIVILICSFLISTEFENTFVSLLVIHIFSLETYLFVSLAKFLIGLFFLYILLKYLGNRLNCSLHIIEFLTSCMYKFITRKG